MSLTGSWQRFGDENPLPNAFSTTSGATEIKAHALRADYDVTETIGLTLVQGRPFSNERMKDAEGTSVLVNEALVRAFGWNDPIGKKLSVRFTGLGVGSGATLTGLALGGLGVGAGESLRGVSVGGLGVGAGEDLIGLTVAGLGAGAGRRLTGLTVAGVAAGAGERLRGLTLAGLAAGAPVEGITVAGAAAGGQRVTGLLVAPAYARGLKLLPFVNAHFD